MKQEIDFLKGQRIGKDVKTKFIHSLKVGSFVLILAYCLIVAAIFSYWLFLSRQIDKVNNEIAVKTKKIANLKEVESLQIVFKQRLSNLDKFFSAQKGPNFATLLSFIEQNSKEVKVKELKMAEGKINFSGLAPNIFILENFLQDLKGESSAKLFNKITLSSIDRQEDGSYLFNVLLEVKG